MAWKTTVVALATLLTWHAGEAEEPRAAQSMKLFYDTPTPELQSCLACGKQQAGRHGCWAGTPKNACN